MKTNRILTIAAFMLLSTGIYAQAPRGERPAPPKMKSPEEIAQKEADMMKEEVGLTDKQYKKVYNLVKKDWQYRQDQAENRFSGMGGPGGMPPQGGMGGPGGMGGGPDGGFSGGMGGFGGMGGSGGMGGGMPPQGGMGGGPEGGFSGGMPPQGGQRPEGGPGMGPGGDIVTEEYLEKQDKKLKKILTEDQYNKWRAKHPAEYMELPPMEMMQGNPL